MKITKEHLKAIIKEELEKTMNEYEDWYEPIDPDHEERVLARATRAREKDMEIIRKEVLQKYPTIEAVPPNLVALYKHLIGGGYLNREQYLQLIGA
jgi:hypothetical protein